MTKSDLLSAMRGIGSGIKIKAHGTVKDGKFTPAKKHQSVSARIRQRSSKKVTVKRGK